MTETAIEELARRVLASEGKTVLSYEIREIIEKFGVEEDIEVTVGPLGNSRKPLAEWDSEGIIDKLTNKIKIVERFEKFDTLPKTNENKL